MALKSDIETALLQNLTPTQDKNFKVSKEGAKKIEVLSEQLAKAIRDYIDSLTFRVNSLKGDTILPTGAIVTNTGVNTLPVPISITVSLDNPTGATDTPNSLQSVVKVDKNDNKDKSGIA